MKGNTINVKAYTAVIVVMLIKYKWYGYISVLFGIGPCEKA